MTTKAKTKKEFRVVYLRLFEEDAAAIDQMAVARGSAFRTELRMVVHEGVRARQLATKPKDSIVR
jgi:predicted DNA binding CopG/RHH family protein